MLRLRQLDLDDVAALVELQEIVRRALPDPQLFQCENESYYAGVIAGTGAGFGAFDGDIMAGYGIVALPGDRPDNLCHDVPFFRIDPADVAHLDGSAVHPDYRGKAIQQRLSELRIAFAAEKGARHLLMTVAPGNPHSLRNHLNMGGFRVRAIKRKYGGMWRLILHRELDCGEASGAGRREFCRLEDIEAHRRLLAAGFLGVRVVEGGNGWELTYEAANIADLVS